MEELRSRGVSLLESQIDLFAATEELDGWSLAIEEGAWLHMLHSRSHSLGIAPAFLAAQLLTRTLKKCSNEDYSKIQFAVKRIQHLQHQKLFDSCYFIEALTRDLKVLPVNVLVSLLEADLIPSSSFLARPTSELTHYLQPVLYNGEGPLLNGLSTWLVHESYTMEYFEAKKLLLSLVNESYYSTEAWRGYNLLDAINSLPVLSSSILCELHCDVLIDLLTNRSYLSVCEVVSCQDNWCCSKLSSNVVHIHTQLLKAIPSGTVIEAINKALAQKLNWPTLLGFISSFANSSSEAALCLKEYVVSLVMKAIEQRETTFFQSSLLLARQAALHGSHVHPSYSTWFQSVFGQLNSALSTRKAQEFVLGCLTELVPYEPAHYLQIHLTHIQSLLLMAKNSSNDYRVLVKTRLQDLSLNADSGHNSQQLPPQHVIEEVERAVTEYREKRTLPPTVQFISCFKRPYFIGHFLPTLLSSSEPISQLPGRDALVEALKNKIPRKMYEAFSHSYSETRNLGGKDEALSSKQLLITELLQQLVSNIVEESSYKVVSQLSNIIKDIVPIQLVITANDTLSLTSPGLLPHHVMIANAVLNALCQLVSGDGCHGNTIQLCLKMFSGHPVLHKAFFVRLWELLSTQITQLLQDQLVAVAGLCSVMWYSGYEFRALAVQAEKTSALKSVHSKVVKMLKEYCECIMENSLPLGSCAQRTAVQLFCSSFIRHCNRLADYKDSPLIPEIVLTKLNYLLSRMPSSTDSQSHKTVKIESDHEQLSDKSQVEFTQWLLWEMSVEEDSLLPYQRESYMRDRLYNHYLPHFGDAPCVVVRNLFVVLVENVETPSYNTALNLFQTVCMSSSLEDHSGATMIVDAALHYLSHISQEQTARAFESILNVLTSVPPWMMFSDGPTPKINCLDPLAKCLPLLMNISDSFMLPSSLLHHLWKGMKVFGNGLYLCERLLQLSPLFEASMIINWPSLCSVITSSISYSNVHSWLHGDLSQVCPRHLRSMVLGVCLYHCLLSEQSSAAHQEQWQVIKDISDTALKEEVLAVMMDCCARQTTEELLSTDSPQLYIAKECVSMYPGTLDACYVEYNSCRLHSELIRNLRCEFCCRDNLHLLPLFFLRILVSLSENELKQVFEFHPSFLSLCISSHSHCMDSHYCAQVMEPGFLQQCTHLVEQFILQTPICEFQEAEQLNCYSTLKPFLEYKLHL